MGTTPRPKPLLQSVPRIHKKGLVWDCSIPLNHASRYTGTHSANRCCNIYRDMIEISKRELVDCPTSWNFIIQSFWVVEHACRSYRTIKNPSRAVSILQVEIFLYLRPGPFWGAKKYEKEKKKKPLMRHPLWYLQGEIRTRPVQALGAYLHLHPSFWSNQLIVVV